jgi:hypothetical protein
MAYWTFISPTTFSSAAMALVAALISIISLPMLMGGRTQAESPL